MAAPSVYDHYRPVESDGDGDQTVYRVVGVGDDRVTLLRLTDRSGSREATGDLRYVSLADLVTDFVASDDPDPRYGIPDYLAGLFVVAGVAMVALPEFDLLAGGVMALAGVWLLWRRGHLSR